MFERLFRKANKPEKSMPEDLEQRTSEVYYSRMLRVKLEIDKRPDVKSNIRRAFEHVYLGEPLVANVTFLDSGTDHSLFNVGRIFDSVNQRDVDLAVRLRRVSSYLSNYSNTTAILFVPQLFAFENAFVSGDNPPYFTGVVSWKGPANKFKERVLGFLVEDVTCGNKYSLIEEGDSEHFYRTDAKCNSKRYFLDPKMRISDKKYSHYLSDEARVDAN